MPHAVPAPIIGGFSALAAEADLLLCDVWGVVHNGLTPHPAACEALAAFRRKGGTVVLLSNAPRPNAEIVEQFARLGVPEGICDAIVTSGDLTQELIDERRGQALHHVGPARDTPMFGDKQRLVPVADADYVVCTGLFDDENETPEDYRDLLEAMRSRNLPMICANPDLVVERGDRLIYCAGALADAYALAGGEVVYAGKPHRPVYEMALAVGERLRGQPVPKQRIMAIGDAIRTDVTGAHGFGVKVLFVAAGIHGPELLGADGEVAPERLAAFLRDSSVIPTAVATRLRW